MRKIICVVLILCLLPFPCIAAESISVSAKAAVLYDPLCNAVLWGKNENLVLGMASTTKIMTAIVAMELGNMIVESKIENIAPLNGNLIFANENAAIAEV